MPTLFPHSLLITIMRLPPLMLSNDPLNCLLSSPSAFKWKESPLCSLTADGAAMDMRLGHKDQQSLVQGQRCYTRCAFPLVLCFPLSIFGIKARLLLPRFQIKPRWWNKRLSSKLAPKAIIWVRGSMTSFSRKGTLAYLKPPPPIQTWMSLMMGKISK